MIAQGGAEARGDTSRDPKVMRIRAESPR